MIVFAGPNGAGKTTFGEIFCKRFGLEFVNPDRLGSSGELDKGREFIKILREKLKRKDSFSLETTMSGKWLLSFLEKARDKNYEIGCFFIFVHPVEILKYRIEERVKKGGHFVDFDTVKRRYKRSLKNFWHVYRGLFDRWEVISNIEDYRKVAIGSGKVYKIEDEMIFRLFSQEVGNGKT